MEIKQMKIGGYDIQFVNETWENSKAWGHHSTLFVNGVERGENKVRYFNRTWERYTYQSCMLGLIYKIKENIRTSFLENYKSKNNIARLTSERKELALQELFDTNEYYKMLCYLNKEL